MPSARKLAKTTQPQPISAQPKSFESLRAFYHSVHENERLEAIEVLGSMSDPDAARELIQLYEECQWRTNRLQMIRVLSKNPTQRSLEFLFKLAQTSNDIPIAEAAVWSLGQSHHRLAAHFLVHFYRNTNDLLKPSVVGALGQIPDRTLLKDFVEELPLAIHNQKVSLAKNLALTLGELKAVEALPYLQELVHQTANSELRLSALIGIGKICRTSQLVASLEPYFRNDLFQYQLFTNIKSQVQFRSKWRLEDYLNRIFDGPEMHKTLPYELSHFDSKDVKEGLKLFRSSHPLERICLVLSKLDFPDISDWYQEFFDLKNLKREEVEIVLRSISEHIDPKMIQPLNTLREHHPECWQEWLTAVSMSIPNAAPQFKEFFNSDHYSGLSEDLRILAINQLYNQALAIQSSPSQLQAFETILNGILEHDPSQAVQGRALRSLAGLGLSSKKAIQLIKQCLQDFTSGAPDVTLMPSCLYYLELCTERNLLSQLLLPLERMMDGNQIPVQLKIAYLKTLSALPELPAALPKLDLFLKQALQSTSSPEWTMAALRLLNSHPRVDLLPEVTETLKREERIQVTAIITLKAFADERATEPVARFLDSKQKSLSGRALDTLTSLPGMRAKRFVIDYLKDHGEDLEICDKIIRCLNSPESPSDYFSESVDQILKKFPLHPHKDGLVLLRERMAPQSSTLGRSGKVKGVDIQAIDQELNLKIAGYSSLEESIKTTLRSAEIPYKHRELFDEYVDKASSIVEYCKAVDLVMEKTLGKNLLFPKLENSLFEFQNIIHAIGLSDSYANAKDVLASLDIEKHFTIQSLPLHKMTLVAQAILNGKIVNEHFKTLDGLRAWAIMILLFGRRIQNRKPVIPLKSLTDDAIVTFCKRLMALQDIRNPLAHRQTVVQFHQIDAVRAEVFALLGLIQKAIG